MFTKAMVERAPSKFKIIVTSRNYSELNQIMRKMKLPHVSLGRHGGGKLLAKLKASVERERELVSFVSKNDFDFSFSFISPEAARVSFGVGMKHFICSDSPHASSPSKLAVPLAQKLFCPYPILKERWMQYGLTESQIFHYHALDPWAWLMKMKRKKHRQRSQIRHVVIRLEESFASYIQSGKGISSTLQKLIDLIAKSGDFTITLVPRYHEQRKWAKKKFGNRCLVPKSIIDGPSVLSDADLVIGGGGTMTQEAALLGIPNISYFPSSQLDVFENFYFPKILSMKASNPTELLLLTRKLIQNLDREAQAFEERARNITRTFEDPVKFVFRNIH
jgi:predicted glycosyltransferase